MKTVFMDGRLCWVSNGDFGQVMEFRAAMLGVELRGRALGPKETVRGWLALFFPKLPYGSFYPDFRFTIADTLGHQTVVETGKITAGNFSNASIQVVSKGQDISKYRLVLIQDLPEYWK